MKRPGVAFLLAGVVVVAVGLGLSLGSSGERKPIAVLIEADPWVAGSSQPTFVLYSDGTVIWRKGLADPKARYLTTKLEVDRFERLRAELAPTDSFLKLKRFYDLAPKVTDQPAVDIYLSQGGRERSVMVSGLKPKGHSSAAFAVLPSDRPADLVPGEFRRLYDAMSTFDHAEVTRWEPEYLQVKVWPFEHAKTPPMPWPSTWPDLNDPRTERHEQMYLLYFPAELEEPVKNFLAERGGTRPALIDGRKWSVTYRYVFPGMSIWEKAMFAPGPSR